MKILFAASECAPLAKVGGLADVVGALPKALQNWDIDVRIILPLYKTIALPADSRMVSSFACQYNKKSLEVKIFQACLPGSTVPLLLAEQPELFGSSGVYGSPTAAPNGTTDTEKFLFFSECVAKFLELSDWKPDLVHAHDWHVSLLPVLIKIRKLPVKTLLTIHNLAMQGLASQDMLEDEIMSEPTLKQDWARSGKINLLRQGILHADGVNTVSPTYAEEITTPEFGEGLDKELINRGDVIGILNGIDDVVWNESNDPFITNHYSKFSAGLKTENKIVLQQKLGLEKNAETPLIVVISRLTGQKGFNLLPPIMDKLLELNFQLAVLGVGEPDLEKFFEKLAADRPTRFSVTKKFDEQLAHQMYASSDIFLMPSKFEPCGLGQLIAMHYGSIPIVRATGGLKDSVENIDDSLTNTEKATGFVFEDFNPEALLSTFQKALTLYSNTEVWRQLQNNAMTRDFSWYTSSRKYFELYREIISK